MSCKPSRKAPNRICVSRAWSRILGNPYEAASSNPDVGRACHYEIRRLREFSGNFFRENLLPLSVLIVSVFVSMSGMHVEVQRLGAIVIIAAFYRFTKLQRFYEGWVDMTIRDIKGPLYRGGDDVFDQAMIDLRDGMSKIAEIAENRQKLLIAVGTIQCSFGDIISRFIYERASNALY